MQNNLIEIKPSKQFFKLILCLLIATWLIVIFLPCNFWVKIILIAVSFLYGRRMFSQPLRGLIPHENSWELHDREQIINAQLSGSSTITRSVCVLRFYQPGRWLKYSYVLFPDSFSSIDEFRRLRIKLKFSKT